MSDRTPATEDEKRAVDLLKRCGYAPASWDKRFVRQLHDDALTDKERPQVWRLFIKYRRQIKVEMTRWCAKDRDKVEALEKFTALMHQAAQLAAPDFRKLNAARMTAAPAVVATEAQSAQRQ